jgi:flavin-dependent dehydrogenase
MEHCDVLIVGGGPAGSSLAHGLVKTGCNALIIDRQFFPRDKVCAGWVTPPILRSLQIDTSDYSQGRVLQPIHGFRIGITGSNQIDTYDRNRVISYGIRRCEFDHYLLERSGARLKLGQACSEVKRTGTTWVVNDSITTSLIAGAGGHYCPVARFMGGETDRRGPVVVAQEVEFRMTPEQSGQCTVCPELPELYFCQDSRGYGWVFRKGDYLNIGLGREDKENLSGHVRSFCEFLVQVKKIPADIPRHFHGHAYLLYQHSRRRVTADGMLLVGDAAGLAFTHSGEGIRPAVESGMLAAEAIRNAQGDYSDSNLAAYRRSIAARFGRRNVSLNFLQLLPDNLRQFLAGHLISNHWFAGKVIIDDWFLHARQQPLLLG